MWSQKTGTWTDRKQNPWPTDASVRKDAHQNGLVRKGGLLMPYEVPWPESGLPFNCIPRPLRVTRRAERPKLEYGIEQVIQTRILDLAGRGSGPFAVS